MLKLKKNEIWNCGVIDNVHFWFVIYIPVRLCSEDIQIEIQMVQKIKALEQILRIPTRTPSGDQTVLTREPIENHC